jgi:hypothetical protein
MRLAAVLLTFVLAGGAYGQVVAPAYTPKFAGDPAHSNAEAAALGYMRTVAYSQNVYKKKHGAYATSLAGLVGTHSFTRRMASPERGEYTAKFHSTGKDWSLALVPKNFDDAHRSFYVDATGTIRAEDAQPATASSEPINKK